jgi:hypothetical protein
MNSRLNITSIDRRFLEQHNIHVKIIPNHDPKAWVVEMYSYAHDTGSTEFSTDLNHAYTVSLNILTELIANKLATQESTHGS